MRLRRTRRIAPDCLGAQSARRLWLRPHPQAKGPLARALGLTRRGGRPPDVDVVALGSGEGSKEAAVLEIVAEISSAHRGGLPWIAYAPVDVSIPLLISAGDAGRTSLARAAPGATASRYVTPFCADFEEGPLSFLPRLPTARADDGTPGIRLVLLLGNIFGNLRDEEAFVRHKLHALTRPGDRVWIEVGLRNEPLSSDPLYRLTQPDHEITASEASRRLLLIGPYRRLEAAIGRRASDVDMRVWVREGDESCRVPGSVNFCHDLVIRDENRVCTMLYSRRYVLEALTAWLEARGFAIEGIRKVTDGQRLVQVAHLLLERR